VRLVRPKFPAPSRRRVAGWVGAVARAALPLLHPGGRPGSSRGTPAAWPSHAANVAADPAMLPRRWHRSPAARADAGFRKDGFGTRLREGHEQGKSTLTARSAALHQVSASFENGHAASGGRGCRRAGTLRSFVCRKEA
jgi:hypothetical protein